MLDIICYVWLYNYVVNLKFIKVYSYFPPGPDWGQIFTELKNFTGHFFIKPAHKSTHWLGPN